MERVMITRARLRELLETEALMQALDSGGVDNWEWYDASIEDHHQEVTEADVDAEAQ
jgi:hypothetical protein